MMEELGVPSTVSGIARHYQGFIDGLIIDRQDASQADEIESLGIKTLVTQTVMKSLEDRIQLAEASVDFAAQISAGASR